MKTISYFLEYIIVSCFVALACCLGIDKASALFGYIAKTIGPILPVSKIARRNIRQAFPKFTQAQLDQVLIDCWENLGRTIGELPMIATLSKSEFARRVEVKGAEHFEEIRKSGKSCIFIPGHFANWEIGPKVGCDAGLRLGVVYRKANNRFVDKQILQFRNNPDLLQIPKGKEGVRDIARSFKEGRCLCFLVDQKLNNGIEVPFFGKNAMTAGAPAKLALDYDCPIIPIQIIRKTGANFAVVIHQPLKINRDKNNSQEIYRIMCKINYIYEGWIKKNPGQWFWLHKRWPKEFYE